MRFDSTKHALFWFFRQKYDIMKPSQLKSIDLSKNTGRSSPIHVDMVDVFDTDKKIRAAMSILSVEEVTFLSRYYRGRRSMSRIQMDAVKFISGVTKTLDKIEIKLESVMRHQGLLAPIDVEEPQQMKERCDVLQGGKAIADYIGRSFSWFNYALKNVKSFRSCVRKVAGRWEATPEALDAWRNHSS